MWRNSTPNVMRSFCHAVALCFVFLFFVPAVDGAHAPTLDDAIKALSDWRASFTSLHMAYEVDETSREEPEKVTATFSDEYFWSESGRFLWDMRIFKEGKQTNHTKYWCDGRTTGRAFYPSGEGKDAEAPTMIDFGQFTPGQKRGIQGMSIAPLQNLWDPVHLDWLPVVLRQIAVAERVIDVDGTDCLELSWRISEDKPATRLVLDPRYSFLPRSSEPGWHYTVEHFKLHPPGIWMPELGQLDLGITNQLPRKWRVLSVEFNKDIDDNKLKMPAPGEGTRMADMVRRKGWFHGKPPASDIQQNDSDGDIQTAEVTTRASVARKNPRYGLPIAGWAAILGVVFLLISWALKRMHRI